MRLVLTAFYREDRGEEAGFAYWDKNDYPDVYAKRKKGCNFSLEKGVYYDVLVKTSRKDGLIMEEVKRHEQENRKGKN